MKDRVVDITDFVDSVRRIARGGSAIDPEVVSQLLGRGGEQEALASLYGASADPRADGRGLNQAIAERLFGAQDRRDPCPAHSIFSKLGLLRTPDDHRRVRAVVMALREA
ncbi:MAG: hypothetical protein U0V56_06375 [Actinomycetota bacterium]